MIFPLNRALAVSVIAASLATVGLGEEPIKIGEFASLSGKEATFGHSSHEGTLMAIDEVNKAGGVLGRQLELDTEDNQSMPGQSATVVKKLISRDKVVAVIGEVASSRSLEAAPICQNAKIPMISPSSTNPKVTEGKPYVFRVCFIDPFQGTVMAKFAKDTLKIHKVAILSSVSSAYSVGLAKYFRERFTADGGEVVIEQKFSEGDKDFNAQLTAIKAAGVEGIFVPGYYSEAGLICKEARELGMTYPLFGGDGWEAPQLIEIGGAAMDGCYYSTHYSPYNVTPEVTAFVEAFKAKYNGEIPDAMAALGYDAGKVLIDAIKRAGTTDGPALKDAIKATKDFDGVTGHTTIDKDRNASKAAVVIAIKDGKFTFLQAVAP